MAIRVLFLTILIHFQSNAQLGMESNGLFWGSQHLEELILNLIHNHASSFKLQVKHFRNKQPPFNSTYRYTVKDSILYQSSGKEYNQHLILKNTLLGFIDDPKHDKLYEERNAAVEKDSANIHFRINYIIRGSDTLNTCIEKSSFDSAHRINATEFTCNGYLNVQKKHTFEYVQTDSIIETIYQLHDQQWKLTGTIVTKLTPDTKIITEYQSGQTDPVSEATFILKDGHITRLVIDYNDQEKKTTRFNARYMIEPEKVKYVNPNLRY